MFPYGAVLKVYREHSMDDIRKNLRDIRALGMNTVVVWPAVFWWEDRSLPDYPYHTGRQILAFAAEIGLQVIMETAGQIANLEYAPDFAMKDEYYVVTKDGTVSRDNNHYYFGYLNYFHPGVKKLMARYLTGIVRAYRDAPALYGYDIWNETMFESYDEHTWGAFRGWLKAKYGDLGHLNDAWESTFNDWRQVRYSQLLWASVLPYVDYKEFHKDCIGMLLEEWKAVVRAEDTRHPVLADNIHSMITENWSYGERAQDDWVLGRSVDEMGISFYPKSGTKAIAPHKRWLIFAATYAASGGRGFWIAELQSHHQALYNPFSAVRPHDLAWWNFEAISHGAQGLIYWKWNAFQKGLQTFGRGLVDPRGASTERAELAREVCAVLQRESQRFTTYKPARPRVAILYDRLSHDYTKAFTLAYAPTISTTIYTDSLEGLYQALWEEGAEPHIVTPADLLHGVPYSCVFVTGQVNLSPALSQALLGYLDGGGTLVCDGKFGEIGDDSLLYASPPGGLSEPLGLLVGDMRTDDLGMTLDVDGETFTLDGFYERRDLRVVHPQARVWGRYGDGQTAVVELPRGTGRLVYASTLLWYGYHQTGAPGLRRFARLLVDRYRLRRFRVDGVVRVTALEGPGGLLLFLFNYNDDEAAFRVTLEDPPPGVLTGTVVYPGAGAAVSLTGATVTGRLRPRETAVYRIDAPQPAREA